MASGEEIRRSMVRQAGEIKALTYDLGRLCAKIRAQDSDRDAAAFVVGPVMRVATTLYELGRSHANEQLRVRMNLPIGTEVTLVEWQGGGCPTMDHVHVAFHVVGEPVAHHDENN